MLSLLTKKPALGALLLASAAGGPYVLYETEAGQSARQTASSLFGSGEASSSANVGTSGSSWFSGGGPSSSFQTTGTTLDLWNFNLGTPAVDQLQGQGSLPPLTGNNITDFREILRFDITPQWVPQRFARVSTVLADMNLDGLRVPVVTGTQIGDVAGTLTYYFDRYQHLQRLNIHGLTGDPERVVQTLQQFYQLRQEPALGGGLYLIKWNGKPTSVLHIAPAPIIYSTAEHSRYSVFLELNQPNIPYGLSSEAQQLIDNGHLINRW
ncbi:MAG: DUF6690 family protein [Aureliella sp.]